jgi:hypothetical protein
VLPNGDYLGVVMSHALRERASFEWDESWRNRKRLEALAISFLGGEAAEERFRGRRNRRGSENDWSNAIDVLSWMAGPEEQGAYLEWLWQRTRAIFMVPIWWKFTEGIAARLLEHRTLDAKALNDLRLDLAGVPSDQRRTRSHAGGDDSGPRR